MTPWWPIRVYQWCALCGEIAVQRRGDMCGRCMGALEVELFGVIEWPAVKHSPARGALRRLCDMVRHTAHG